MNSSSRTRGTTNTPPTRPDSKFKVLTLFPREPPAVESAVDIVAIHGIDGDRERSWTAENGKMWLKDLDMLPAHVNNARILTYGYASATWGEQQLAGMTMQRHAQNLVVDVVKHREITGTPTDRPIIFIAHNIGGIILKFALIGANDCHKDHIAKHKIFSEATKGILFMGTPHQGTDGVTGAKHFAKLYSLNGQVDQTLAKDLETYSETLLNQIDEYCGISQNFITKFVYEIYPTKLSRGTPHPLVPNWSAVVPGATNAETFGLYKNHSNLVRFESPGDPDYDTIKTTIVLMIREILRVQSSRRP